MEHVADDEEGLAEGAEGWVALSGEEGDEPGEGEAKGGAPRTPLKGARPQAKKRRAAKQL